MTSLASSCDALKQAVITRGHHNTGVSGHGEHADRDVWILGFGFIGDAPEFVTLLTEGDVGDGLPLKLLPKDGELYVFAQSEDRVQKERAMRQRQLKRLVKRLKQLQQMTFKDGAPLLMKLGAAKARYRAAWRLLDIDMPKATAKDITFSFRLNRDKLRKARRREGRYLLRTNLAGHDPAKLWQLYIQLVEVEAAFKTLKDDLSLRPIYHQLEHRIEAHIFVAFIAYGLHVTLRARLKPLAAGLTPRAVLDKFAAIQMIDVHFPTTDGRTLVLSRYTEPTPDQKILLKQLNLAMPAQPPPRISPAALAIRRRTSGRRPGARGDATSHQDVHARLVERTTGAACRLELQLLTRKTADRS